MDKDTKAKVIVGVVIMVVVLFIVIYAMMVFGGGNNRDKQSQRVSFEAPKLKKKEYEYNKRIDLVNEKGYVAQSPKVRKEDTPVVEGDNHAQNPFLEEIGENNKAPQTTQREQKPIQQERPTASVKTKPSYGQAQKQEVVEVEPVREIPQRRKKRYLSNDENANSQPSSSYQVSESIPCRIYGDHKVTNNSKIKARITKDVTINNIDIKRNTIVTGIVRLSESKVNIRFETIQYENKTINANMRAYSRDGLEGIYIEGGIGDETKKDAYDEIIDAASPSTTDKIPFVGGLLKTTTKKQNNRVYVDIPNDYTIYLRK